MVKTKPFRRPEGKKSKNSTGESKGQAPKSNNYKGKNTREKSQGTDTNAKTNFKGWCSNLEGHIFDLGLRYLEFFSQTMKEMEWYLVATCSDICQPANMNDTPANFPEPEMPTIIPDMGIERPKNRHGDDLPQKYEY